MMGFACYEALSDNLLAAQITAAAARATLISSAMLPLAAYVLFLLCSLLLDVCRAILMLPEKAGKATQGNEEQNRGQ